MANYRWFGKFHCAIYQATDGRVGHWLGRPMVLMKTVGANSGLARNVVLQYYPIVDNGIIVIASNNGQRKPPDWWFNLKAQREALWQRIRQINPPVDSYQKNAGREIPVMLLRTLPSV